MKTVITLVYAATALTWIYGITHHRFLMREFWLYAGIFFIPGALVCLSTWLTLQKAWWKRVTGALTLLPGMAIWLISLLLVTAGFKIH